MLPIRRIEYLDDSMLHPASIEWYKGNYGGNEDCATMFHCIIARYGTTQTQVVLPHTEMKWFTDFIRSKSPFLILLIVDVINTQMTWDKIKPRLIHL